MSEDETICGLPLTKSWLEQRLLEAKFVSPEHKLSGVEAGTIGEGKGFFSHIIKCRLTWSAGKETSENEVVLKVPQADSFKGQMKEMLQDGKQEQSEDEEKKQSNFMDEAAIVLHGNECAVYDLFRETPIVTMAKSYFTQLMTPTQPGVIAMESLSGHGQMVNIGDGLRFEQLKTVLTQVARLQAYALRNPDWSVGVTPIDRKKSVETSGPMIKAAVTSLEELDPERFKDIGRKLEWMANGEAFNYALYESHQDVGIPPCIVHGDLWAHNLIFEADKSQDNEAKDNLLAILDWQVIHDEGLATTDIARVICSSAADGIFVSRTPELLRHFYETLTSECDGKPPYDWPTLERAWKEGLKTGAFYAIFGAAFFPTMGALDGPNFERRKESLLRRAAECISELERQYPKECQIISA